MGGFNGNKYVEVLKMIKEKIRNARLRAVLSANREMLLVYFEIGKTLSEQEATEGWGAKTVEKLSNDLRTEFPEIKGFSPRNLRYMRELAVAYPHFPFLQAGLAKISEDQIATHESTKLQVDLAKLPWYHHITLLDKVKDPVIRKFYIEKAIEYGWARDIMVHHIESQLHVREGISHAFRPAPLVGTDSELARQLFKDPFKLDFISLGPEAKERDLELALTSQITKFLLELGQWFAFLGRQFKVVAGEKEYFYDLLFYHTRMKRYLIVELKIGDFKPEYVGKMDLYLAIADETIKMDDDNKSIGLILCKTKDKMVAEYTLRDSIKPIGISEYRINQLLPNDFRDQLPSIEEIESKMEELQDDKTSAQKRLAAFREKLNTIKRKEIELSAKNAQMDLLFYKILQPLYEGLLERLNEFGDDFVSQKYSWQINHTSITSLGALEEHWKQLDPHGTFRNIQLNYQLKGFKKAGVEGFDITVGLLFIMDEYWYGFRIININNQAPIVKKLYSEQLSKDDILEVCDVVCHYVIDFMESQLGHIANGR